MSSWLVAIVLAALLVAGIVYLYARGLLAERELERARASVALEREERERVTACLNLARAELAAIVRHPETARYRAERALRGPDG